MTSSTALPSQDLAQRFSHLIRELVDAVAVHSARHRFLTPLLMLVWSRPRRMARRFSSVAARAANGQKQPRSRKPALPPTAPRVPLATPLPSLPRSSGWLLHYAGRDAAIAGDRLRRLLEDDPDMRALLLAAPQLGRILRPLWRMVCIDPLPPLLARPPKPATPPASLPASPDPPTLLAKPA